MKRVVISGMGVVSPNGIGRNAFKNSILKGMSGISKIDFFDNAFDSRVAGQVHLNGEYFSKKEKRNLPRVAQFAVTVSYGAGNDNGDGWCVYVVIPLR